MRQSAAARAALRRGRSAGYAQPVRTTFPGFMFDGRPFAGFNYMREAVSGENFQQALEAGQIVAWAASGLVGPEPHLLIPSAPAATA